MSVDWFMTSRSPLLPSNNSHDFLRKTVSANPVWSNIIHMRPSSSTPFSVNFHSLTLPLRRRTFFLPYLSEIPLWGSESTIGSIPPSPHHACTCACAHHRTAYVSKPSQVPLSILSTTIQPTVPQLCGSYTHMHTLCPPSLLLHKGH